MQPPNRRRPLNDILNDLAETVEQPEDEAICEEAREVLAEYVGLELDAADAPAAYPTVARHLLVCPSCIQHYQRLRALLTSEEPVAQPPRPFDMRLLSTPQTLTLSPQDVVPPPQPPTAPAQLPLAAWLRAEPARLQRLRASSTRASTRGEHANHTPESAYAYQRDLQELDEQGRIEFTPSLEQGRAQLLGRLHPWEQVRGKRLRLYALASAPELQLSLVHEAQVGALGRIKLSDLDPDTYILALVRDDGEDLPLTLLNASDWQEEQPA